jgi:type II secretory pathway predicted ATPase ExeA
VYWQHFGLSAEPFSLTPDPAFLYMSEGHGEALAALKLGLLERRGLLAMIGEVGTGKTTLLYSLLAGLEAEIKTAYVSNTRLSFDDILRTILGDFGVTPASSDRLTMLDALNDFLVDCAEQDTTAAVIIDEAQNLSAEAFEEIRLLSNFETYTTKLLQIVLVGQPELATKLNQRELRQINERIAVRCHLNPLTDDEARSYIEHRLVAAGGSIDVFSRRALATITNWSSGIPRRINILSHNSLLFAYGRGLTTVTPGIVEDAIRDQEGAGLRRFDQPARYERGGLGGAFTRRARATGPVYRRGGGMLRWAVGGVALGLTAALTLVVGRGEEPAAAAIDNRARIATEQPANAAEVQARRERRAGRRHARNAERAVPEPGAELAPEVSERLEQALARLDEAAAAAATAAVAETGATGATGESPAAASADAEQAAQTDETAVEAVASAPGPAADAAVETAAEVAAVAAPATDGGSTKPDTIVSGSIAAIARNIESAHVVMVPPGSTLSTLMVSVYGDYRPEFLEAVRDANPHILDPHRIQAGDVVIFPTIAVTTTSRDRRTD